MNKQMKTLIYVIMAISLICCTYIGIRRIQVENDYKSVEIAVRYSDILRIAMEEDIPLAEVLANFKEMGATTLFVKENTVATVMDKDYYSYKGLGDVTIIEGYILKFYYPEANKIKPEERYIMTEDKQVADAIYENYAVKGMELERLETDGIYLLEIGDYATSLTTIGVGFNKDNLNLAAELGFSIDLQIKNWEVEDEETLQRSLQYLMSEIDSIPNVNTIYFADSKVPGASAQSFINFIDEKYQLGFIEFSSNKQEGFRTLAKATSDAGTHYKIVRLHTLEDGNVDTFSIQELMERYDLALKERNNRVFLFKMPKTEILENDYTYIKEAITTFSAHAKEAGYTLSSKIPDYNLPYVPAYLTFLAGLGAIMVVVLLFAQIHMVKLGYIVGVLGVICYAGLLKVKPLLGCQMIAFLGSIVFPTYGVLSGVKGNRRNLKETLLTYAKICFIAFGGALTIIGVLSKTNFALAIDSFSGVKLATTLPIILVLAYLIYKEHQLDVKFYTSILEKKISYGALLVIGLLIFVLSVYVSRSGNSGNTLELELMFRQFLDNTLGVRPRTKEILIGYPILLAFLYYGYKERYLLFMIFAIMGPISLVNTYAHIHTPIFISLIRSAYGILIGAIVGLFFIWVIKIVSRVIKKWQMQ